IAAGQSSIEQSWLAFHIEVEIPVVLALVAGVLVVRLVAQLASTYVSVRLSATRARTIPQALIADSAEAEWATKSTERMGHLQEAVSSFVTSCNQVILTGTKAVTFAMSLVVLVVSALVVSPVSALAIAGTTAVISAALRPLALK